MNKRDKLYKDSGQEDIIYVMKAFLKYCLRLGWIVIIISGMVGLGAFIMNEINYTPQYTSKVNFTVNNVYAVQSDYKGNWSGIESTSAAISYILKTNLLRDEIQKELGEREMPWDIKVVRTEQTNFLTVTVTSKDAKLSYDTLNLIVDNFMDKSNALINNSGLQVIKEPELPVLPDNQDDNLKFGLKVGGGCFVAGIAILFLYAYLVKKIRSPEDMLQGLQIPCIANVPAVRFKKRSKPEEQKLLLINKRTGQKFIDAYRLLRRRVERDHKLNGHQVYLISSTMQAEGKTVASVNLAIALSEKEYKVVLIDGDLRNPSVYACLGMPENKQNLEELLIPELNYKDILTDVNGVKNLKVIYGTEPIEEPTEMLSTGKIKALIEELRKEFDYIIIDTSPIGLVVDAAILAEWADAGIFVVKYDFMTLEAVDKASGQLVDGGIKIIGGILNGVVTNKGNYGGYYGYAYKNTSDSE